VCYVEAFTNLNPDARLRGHAPGDALDLCYAAWRGYLLSAPREDALTRIFAELNSDERAGRRVFPSLSVGDVVSLEAFPLRSPTESSSHAVAPVGFVQRDETVWATASEHNRLRERLGEPPLVRLVLKNGTPKLLGKPKGVAVEVAVPGSGDGIAAVRVECYGPAAETGSEGGG
jgi:hypothetical protein